MLDESSFRINQQSARHPARAAILETKALLC